MFVISDSLGGGHGLRLHSVNHSPLPVCDGWSEELVFCAADFLNVLVLSARATCPATIHDRAVTAARAPMCRNGPVAWTEGGETEERG